MSFPPSGPPYPGAPNQPQPPQGAQNQPYAPYGQPAQPQPYGAPDPYGQPQPGQYGQPQPGQYGQPPQQPGAYPGGPPPQGGPWQQGGPPGTPPPFPGAPGQGGNPFDPPPPGFGPPQRPGRGGAIVKKLAGFGGVIVVGGILLVGKLFGGDVDTADFNGAERDDQNAEIVEAGSMAPWELKVGDCFNDDDSKPLPTDPNAPNQTETVYRIKALPCTDLHNSQVVKAITMDGVYPGDDAIMERCQQELGKWADGHKKAEGKLLAKYEQYGVLSYFPGETDWSTSSNRVTCSVYVEQKTLDWKLPT